MSNLPLNSIAGAVLASVLGAMGLGIGADALMATHYPETPGYAPQVETAAAQGGAATPAGPPDYGALMGDPAQLQTLVDKGGRLVAQCRSCHNFDQGGPNGTGPNLWGVLGRKAGGHAGFAFSESMAAYGQSWSYDNLDRYLASPPKEVPGNRMAFAGLRKQDDRVAVIAYLRSLAGSPAALPAPLAAPAAAPAPAADGAPS